MKNMTVTNKLIIANVIMFIPSLLLYNTFGNTWYQTIGHFQLWRLVTAMFSHANIAHLIGNMWVLFSVGNTVEHMSSNKSTYLVSYFICGIGAGFASILLNHSIMTVGASGAISGLMAMELKQFKANKTVIIIGFIYLLVTSIMVPNVDVVGHLAGFVIGLILGAGMM